MDSEEHKFFDRSNFLQTMCCIKSHDFSTCIQQSTNWINGESIVLAKEPLQLLLRWTKVDNTAVRTFHRGQPQSAKAR